ncbi:MAG: hypothetical protein NTW76_07790 [Corynebacteriales bacterium]|uniref:Uncharacterized protein n=1 Tax=Williamsia herbipolensis TaxID=1603258 RepID=A0AAU4K1L9_9NOCA|nr:hypothetical protein [Williamsia herbipolensis]MCX6469200.1 hypothetical protein [Mycobacteriales bacterium]
MLTVIVLTAMGSWGVVSPVAAVLIGSMISLRDVGPSPAAPPPATVSDLHAPA